MSKQARLNNKILIIEDEPLVMEAVRNFLKGEAYDIFTAENGQDGLALYNKENPDVIILDLELPVMDGFQFLNHLNLSYNDSCSVLIITGYGNQENIKKCYEYGISGFLRKPFNEYELRGLVKHSIALKREQRKAEYLASFPKISLNPLLEVNASGEITFYNDAAINVLNELGVNKNLKLFLPENINEILEELKQEKEALISRETQIKDRIFDENIHVIPQFGVVRIYTRDITKRKQAEKQLVKLQTAVEQSPSIVVITDVNGNVEYVNPKFSELTGYTAEETIGRNLYILKSGRQSNKIYKELWDSINEGFEWHGELHNRKKSGEFYWESASISPIRNKDNVVIHFVKVAEDITRRKNTEEELFKHHHKLEDLVDKRAGELKKTYEQLIHSEKLSAIGKLSATIAHEFNNPIFGIANVLRMIKNELEMDPDLLNLVTLSLRECDRLSELVSRLKEFHRPSSGGRLYADINIIIDEVAALMIKTFQFKNITFQKNFAADLPLIKVVPDQIKQVILNMLNNAEQAMPKEGGEIQVSTKINNKFLNIDIYDSGAGIKDDDIESLFEPFFTTKKADGTGLGLSVSYGIIKDHGGDIKVSSKQGKGATFTIILPLNDFVSY